MAFQQTRPTQVFLRSDLLLPLKRRMGFGNKECRCNMDSKPTLFVDSIIFPRLNNFIYQLGDSKNILICFCRKSKHKI